MTRRRITGMVLSLLLYSLLTCCASLLAGRADQANQGDLYPVAANLLTGPQFLVKGLLGEGDIVTYEFHLPSFLLGGLVWALLTLFVLRYRQRRPGAHGLLGLGFILAGTEIVLALLTVGFVMTVPVLFGPFLRLAAGLLIWGVSGLLLIAAGLLRYIQELRG
ncbi:MULTISPECIES: hypothetical protein [Paenibacillus]|uniref:hypothetical protein n=1 Tax=Paenibacillus TaxID=44249 RepID=UPI0022B8CCD4|nr:hypothetical protein [Paenibacillus caseinilyticus]MCZ8522304.1 hypothetical protein [Paenibacillus caseinilyticus]